MPKVNAWSLGMAPKAGLEAVMSKGNMTDFVVGSLYVALGLLLMAFMILDGNIGSFADWGAAIFAATVLPLAALWPAIRWHQ